MADNRISSIFGAYATQLQAIVDFNYAKFAPTFFQKYFRFGSPQMNLTYATAIGKSRIEAAASVVAHGAPAPIRSRATLDRLSGEVAAIKEKFKMSETDFRNFLMLQQSAVDDATKKQQILDLIWGDLKKAADSAFKRLDIMVCQALSTGKIVLSSTTNPDGLIYSTDIDLLMPSANLKTVTDEWTVGNAATAKPITDIMTTVAAGETAGISFTKILMPKALFLTMVQITEVVNALKGFFRVASGSINPTLDQVNTYLVANMLPPIEIVDVAIGVEKDGAISTIRPWDADNVAFVPGDNLGVIHNAVPIEKVMPISGTNYASVNNALISKWQTRDPLGEFTQVELNAFPGVETIDSIYILQTDTV